MKILHTSDWHLGRKLCSQERSAEFKQFLDWLTGVITSEKVDALVVAGDVFDSSTPPVWAQSLYYKFLTGLAGTCCKSAVVVAGNHDSAALLDAPRDVLSFLNVFVVGCPRSAEEEVFELEGSGGGAVCCAVPFLRSRDLGGAMVGEDASEIAAAELRGFSDHYAAVAAAAEERRAGRDIPLVAVGHCFVAGGKVVDDDGVRELSVGTLDVVPLAAFPENLDYLALGHLHAPQICGGRADCRYSGAPLCLGFGEAGRSKCVLLVDFDGRTPSVRALPVPEFQKIVRLNGTFDEIAAKLGALTLAGSSVWVEAVCTEGGGSGMNERIRDLVPDGSPVKILRVKVPGAGLDAAFSGDGDLNEDWSPREVFKLYMKEHDIAGEEADALMGAYMEALEAVLEEAEE